VKAILGHTGPNFIHYVIANKEKVPSKLLKRYEAFGQEPVRLDDDAVSEQNVKLVKANLLHQEDYVRHSPEKLGRAIIRLLVI